jgi:S1-C subfamily serine protease
MRRRTSMSARFAGVAAALAALAVACTGSDATPTPTPEASVEPTSTATETPTPTATPAGPLQPDAIFSAVSPAIAFVETPAGTGSGMLISNEWLISNAHVVWPYDTVRVAFGDGTEFLDAEVYAWDTMADLAVIRLPGGYNAEPVHFADPAELSTGSRLYLIGYPAETEHFPQPTISEGVLSRFREWETAGLTYVQTDAAITGGQSGGALVNDRGAVVGLSGFKFADTFGLALAAPIVDQRTQALIDGTAIDAFEDRRLSGTPTSDTITAELDSYYAQRAYIIDEPVGTVASVTASSDHDLLIDITDGTGVYIDTVDDTFTGAESTEFEVDYDAPFIAVVAQYEVQPGVIEVSGSPALIPFDDGDDGTVISGSRTAGNIDFFGDYDTFLLDLDEGETHTIRVESLNIDADLTIDTITNEDVQLAYDDDSAGGLFGTDPEVTFTAPNTGRYLVVVTDYPYTNVGGYYIVIE